MDAARLPTEKRMTVRHFMNCLQNFWISKRECDAVNALPDVGDPEISRIRSELGTQSQAPTNSNPKKAQKKKDKEKKQKSGNRGSKRKSKNVSKEESEKTTSEIDLSEGIYKETVIHVENKAKQIHPKRMAKHHCGSRTESIISQFVHNGQRNLHEVKDTHCNLNLLKVRDLDLLLFGLQNRHNKLHHLKAAPKSHLLMKVRN